MVVRAVVTALLALALAGCLAPAVGPNAPTDAPPAHDAPPRVVASTPPAPSARDPRPQPLAPAEVGEVLPLEVTAPDGVVLRGHVYLPRAEGPFAAVLAFGPYWGNEFPETGAMKEAREGRQTLRAIYADTTYANLSAAGFAVAFVNVRGTGASGGCFHFFNPADGADAAAIIGHLAGRPWSTGAVGMYGVSYDAWTQYAAMTARPPHLRAVVPVSGILDVWSVSTRHGAMYRTFVGSGTGYTLLAGMDGWSAASGTGDAAAPRPDPAHACPEGVGDTAQVDVLAAHGDRTAALVARDLRTGVAASGVPALAVYGLRLAQMPGSDGRVAPFETTVMNAHNLSDVLPTGSRVLVGQWGHGPPTPQVPNFPELVIGWMAEHLRSGPATALPAARYQDASGTWRDAERWPSSTRELMLHLDGQALSPRRSAEAAPRMVASSDRHPDLSDCHPDKAVYLSPPLARDVHLAGSFVLDARVEATAPDGNLAAYVYAVRTNDACAAEAAVEVGRAHTDLRHRGFLARGEPFPVDRAEPVRLTSAPFAATVPAGSRLALVIAGGDGLELVPKALKPMLTIGTGALLLPLADDEDGRPWQEAGGLEASATAAPPKSRLDRSGA